MSRVKVLVVESDPWLGEQFQRTLKKHDFAAELTSNAYSAIDVVDDFRPDIIVMGLLLSGAGGLGLLHELQSYTDTARVPVIVCSDMAALISPDELQPYGVVRVLDTGVMQPDDLPATVRSVLGLAKGTIA